MISMLIFQGVISVLIVAALFTGATHLFWPGKVKTKVVFPCWCLIIDGASTGGALTVLVALFAIIGGSAFLLLRRPEIRRMFVRK